MRRRMCGCPEAAIFTTYEFAGELGRHLLEIDGSIRKMIRDRYGIEVNYPIPQVEEWKGIDLLAGIDEGNVKDVEEPDRS